VEHVRVSAERSFEDAAAAFLEQLVPFDSALFMQRAQSTVHEL